MELVQPPSMMEKQMKVESEKKKKAKEESSPVPPQPAQSIEGKSLNCLQSELMNWHLFDLLTTVDVMGIDFIVPLDTSESDFHLNTISIISSMVIESQMAD